MSSRIITKHSLQRGHSVGNAKRISALAVLSVFIFLGIHQMKIASESDAALVEANLVLEQQVWEAQNRISKDKSN